MYVGRIYIYIYICILEIFQMGPMGPWARGGGRSVGRAGGRSAGGRAVGLSHSWHFYQQCIEGVLVLIFMFEGIVMYLVVGGKGA